MTLCLSQFPHPNCGWRCVIIPLWEALYDPVPVSVSSPELRLEMRHYAALGSSVWPCACLSFLTRTAAGDASFCRSGKLCMILCLSQFPHPNCGWRRVILPLWEALYDPVSVSVSSPELRLQMRHYAALGSSVWPCVCLSFLTRTAAGDASARSSSCCYPTATATESRCPGVPLDILSRRAGYSVIKTDTL